jgi:hypothetical protein
MATDKPPARAGVEENARAGAVQKKTYRRPLLTAYGHISKLTLGGAGTGNDGGAVGKRKMCL